MENNWISWLSGGLISLFQFTKFMGIPDQQFIVGSCPQGITVFIKCLPELLAFSGWEVFDCQYERNGMETTQIFGAFNGGGFQILHEGLQAGIFQRDPVYPVASDFNIVSGALDVIPAHEAVPNPSLDSKEPKR